MLFFEHLNSERWIKELKFGHAWAEHVLVFESINEKMLQLSQGYTVLPREVLIGPQVTG